ncbi:MAG: 23S rRNA (adenine(1618)-N(6))-methyltransferase RlmF, partial [Cytophagales bacterium]|nr:23S rRNA (adenine(1618)-N(6))-methyltransferase RlmF [Cytophagales bacterium]
MRKEFTEVKSELHPRNRHRNGYDFSVLSSAFPALKSFVKTNEHRKETIDFFDPQAVKALNKALLLADYGLEYWDIPDHALCPPVPGRADYIHYLADFLELKSNGNSKDPKIKCLDIGVGANCIYPIIGVTEYGWKFVGSDIDSSSLASAKKIVQMNPSLMDKIELRQQSNKSNIFTGIIHPGETFDFTLCNPPFHSSLSDARAGTTRKLQNLLHQKKIQPVLNFGGKGHELWYEGGEARFLKIMIEQSAKFKSSCRWFTTLVSKKDLLENAR